MSSNALNEGTIRSRICIWFQKRRLSFRSWRTLAVNRGIWSPDQIEEYLVDIASHSTVKAAVFLANSRRIGIAADVIYDWRSRRALVDDVSEFARINDGCRVWIAVPQNNGPLSWLDHGALEEALQPDVSLEGFLVVLNR